MFWHMLANGCSPFVANLLYDTILNRHGDRLQGLPPAGRGRHPAASGTLDFEPEFTAKVFKRGLRVFEVPITFNPRG